MYVFFTIIQTNSIISYEQKSTVRSWLLHFTMELKKKQKKNNQKIF